MRCVMRMEGSSIPPHLLRGGTHVRGDGDATLEFDATLEPTTAWSLDSWTILSLHGQHRPRIGSLPGRP